MLLASCSADGVDASNDSGSPDVVSDSDGAVGSYDGRWLEDYEEAKALAVSLDRPMLLDFAGSDWCGWCMKLEEDVFSKEAFETYAEENLVLVLLDFPRNKPQSDELRAQNAGLKAALGVGGFPTVVLLSPDGKELGRTGYEPGGPGPLIEWLAERVEED